MPEPSVTVPPADAWAGHMRRGDFDAAWAVSDAVLRRRAETPCWHLPRHEQYVWRGRPLAGRRVLVRCYHGLGDTIQFVRYAPLLRSVAAHVTVWAQPELLSLLSTVGGIDRLLPLHDGAPEADYDVDVEIMELPHALRTTPATLPAAVPYLHVPPADRKGDGRLAVGIVWRSGGWDPRRSVPFEALAPLADLPGVGWHVLQQDAATAGRTPSFGRLGGSDDVYGLARVMRSLDLVVTVDSMTAHLAGALGAAVWTLLPADADWRWGEGRDDSPWYPTMRLFRQDRGGDWDAVVARVAAALQRVPLSAGSTAR